MLPFHFRKIIYAHTMPTHSFKTVSHTHCITMETMAVKSCQHALAQVYLSSTKTSQSVHNYIFLICKIRDFAFV